MQSCELPSQTKDKIKHEKELLKNDLSAIEKIKGKSLKVAKAAYENLLLKIEEEKNRSERIETKLATLFVLCAVLASFVFSVIGWGVSNLHWVILVSAGYCLLQLICILFAVVDGLRRQAYLSQTIAGLVPVWIATETKQVLKGMKSLTEGFHDFQIKTNRKGTRLEIAHVALKNFLVGIVVLFISSILFSKPQPDAKSIANAVIDVIEKRPNLQEIFKGPKGDTGPPGQPCTIISAGTKKTH